MLSTCLLSDVSQIEGCLAGLDVDAMVCMLTQGDGWILEASLKGGQAVSGLPLVQRCGG